MHQALAVCALDEARIQARNPPLASGGIDVPHAAFDPFRHMRLGRPFEVIDPEARYGDRLAGEHAYVGVLGTHFGHLMSEHIHRILPTLAAGVAAPWVVVASVREHGHRLSQLPLTARAAYEFLGLTEETTAVIGRHTIAERLHVAAMGSDGTAKPAYLGLLGDFTVPRLAELGHAPTSPSGRLYVSRSKLPPIGRGVCGERYLEAVLQAQGFTVFHPQDHPLSAQLQAYASAEVVMFAEGSALNGLELFGAAAIERILITNRRGGAAARRILRIIAPRAKSLHYYGDNFYLGTAMRELPSGPRRDNFGVSMVNIFGVLRFLRTVGVDVCDDIDLAAFFRTVDEDLAGYLSAPLGKPHGLDEGAIADILSHYRIAYARTLSGTA